jgi:methylated-DNA-protein-cysteine methyltransferase-like protein
VKKSNFFERVYKEVRKIPEGTVMTYGQIASKLGTKDARRVGHALHALKYAQGKPVVPCHRVVNKDGRLAPSYAFGGYHEQKNRLIAEGVKFIDELHVDLDKCGKSV